MINKLKALHEAATKGPWGRKVGFIRDETGDVLVDCTFRRDTELIVTIRNCLPELLEVVEAANRLTYKVLAQREIQDDTLSATPVSELKDTLDALEKKVGDV